MYGHIVIYYNICYNQDSDKKEGISNMTNKFLAYDLVEGEFLNPYADLEPEHDLQHAAMFSKDTLRAGDEHYDEVYTQHAMTYDDYVKSRYLQIPLTQTFVDALPFNLVDTDPNTPMSTSYDNTEALKGDFVILTEYGFYDEKYNSLTNSSRPQVRGFTLDYANLYNMEQLNEHNNGYITNAGEQIPPIIIPVSKEQQAMLEKLPAFSSEKEPYGFFMKPLNAIELNSNCESASESLNTLEDALRTLGEESEFTNIDQDFADAIESLDTDENLEL